MNYDYGNYILLWSLEKPEKVAKTPLLSQFLTEDNITTEEWMGREEESCQGFR